MAVKIQTEDVETRLIENLKASNVRIIDISGGCGTSFEVYVVSDLFEGKKLLQRQRMVNEALGDLMDGIHALSIKQTKTNEEISPSC